MSKEIIMDTTDSNEQQQGEALLPCRFCGKEAKGFWDGPYLHVSGPPDGLHFYSIVCNGCCSTASYESKERAIEKWNTRSRPVSAAPAGEFPVSPAPNDYGRKEGNSMPKDYDGFRQGMLRAAEMARNEFKRAPEATKGHDCVYMSGYEDACDHLSVVIAQAAVIDSVRIAGAQPDWQYHIGLLLPEGIEDEALLKVFQVVEHELRRAATTSSPAAQPEGEQDGWVTFGRVKVDIENETETFERIYPPAPPTQPEGEQETMK